MAYCNHQSVSELGRCGGCSELVYTFVIEDENGGGRQRSIEIGFGTLAEGAAMVQALDDRFEKLGDGELETLPKTDPLSLWEGNDVAAWHDGVRRLYFTDQWENC